MQEIKGSSAVFCGMDSTGSEMTAMAVFHSRSQSTSTGSSTSPSPTDIPMTSLESEESENSNPELERTLEAFVSQEIQGKISKILEDVQQLSDTEKLLLYLRLPGESCADTKDEFDQTQGLPISTTRAEQTQAFHWIRCHLEECDNSSTLPKHEVYDEYKAYCESMNAARTLSAPDFGKIIKCVFPRVKARRLGTRGNSKYCYSGIQRKMNVKPPQLPSLQIPEANDNDKGNGNQGGLNGGDKIEEDQTLSAACLLVCEWANKLLGRVFTTLIELARFLVGGSYVSSKSMAAFVVMSSTDSQSQVTHITNSLFTPQKVEDPIILTHKRRQTHQQLQKKIHQRQQQKHQPLGHAIIPQPAGQPAQILPKTQSDHNPLHKQTIHIPLKASQSAIQNAPTAHIQFYQPSPPHPASMQGTTSATPPTGFAKMRPLTPSLMSPTAQNQGVPKTPQTPSPFQASPKYNPPGTPQNRPVTPSSGGNTPRQTPSGIEPTRFLFTPIANGPAEQKGQRGETSPTTTLRPTATHPGNQTYEWQTGGVQQLHEGPMSPTKQPRLGGHAPPVTPTRRPNSFPYPLSSPRTPQRMQSQQFVTSPPMMSPSTPRSLMNAVSPSCVNQRGQEFVLLQNVNSQDGMVGMNDGMDRVRRGSDSSPNMVSDQGHMIKQGCGTPRPCRYSTSSENGQLPPSHLSQLQNLDYSAELEAICKTAVNNAGSMPPPYQRSQSVPPLPQNAIMDKRLHPLTPQTNNRLHMTPTPMDTSSSNQHINGLKELRNRVLHGDVNNNGSRSSLSEMFGARRNLTSLLNAEAVATNAHPQAAPNLSNWNTENFQTGQTGSTSSEEQEMEMLETNLNFSDLTSDGDANLPDLNTLDDATAEVVLRNICNNTSGVWPTSDVGSWGATQTLQIME